MKSRENCGRWKGGDLPFCFLLLPSALCKGAPTWARNGGGREDLGKSKPLPPPTFAHKGAQHIFLMQINYTRTTSIYLMQINYIRTTSYSHERTGNGSLSQWPLFQWTLSLHTANTHMSVSSRSTCNMLASSPTTSEDQCAWGNTCQRKAILGFDRSDKGEEGTSASVLELTQAPGSHCCDQSGQLKPHRIGGGAGLGLLKERALPAPPFDTIPAPRVSPEH